jgi:type I restriction enzyme M protein
LIDASKDYVKRGKQSELTEEHQRKIADAYLSFADQEGFAKVVSVDEVLSNDGLLSVAKYIAPKSIDHVSLTHSYSEWRTSVVALAAAGAVVTGEVGTD